MTVKTSNNWWEQNTPPEEYYTSYMRALRRMALVLNVPQGPSASTLPCQAYWLSKSDEKIESLFAKHGLDKMLVAHLKSSRHLVNDIPDDFDQAENLFYGQFEFGRARGYPGVMRVTHRSTDAFREWSFKGLYWPKTSSIRDQEIKLKNTTGRSDSEFMMNCATNYLLKNFWHNYLHRQFHGINDLNYHAFGGEARRQNDFQADNLGAIFFLHSYGIHIGTAGRRGIKQRNQVEAILAQNRCNTVFMERERHRIEKLKGMDPADRYSEAEWLFRRRIANSLINHLLDLGMAVASIGIYLTGSIRRSNRNDWFWRTGNVVVELNNCWIDTQFSPKIYDPAKGSTARKRASLAERRDDIVRAAYAEYQNRMKREANLRNFAKDSLKVAFHRAGIHIKTAPLGRA